MTNVAKSLRERLAATWVIAWPRIHTLQESTDTTVKLLLQYADGALVETVLIPEKDRFTQCLSTQVGCAMGCTFCSTGKMGFLRNLTGGEIAMQVLVARDLLGQQGKGDRLTNLVFMGMGEPLMNWPEVKRSMEILHSEHGLNFSRRKITLSTCGIKKGLQEFAKHGLALPAISLHAPTQELRKQIMPGAARLPLDELMALLESYPLQPRERVTIEYILLGGVNDTPQHARQLVKLLARLKCKVNLIAFNPGPGIPYKSPTREAVLAFEQILWDKGMTCILRKSKGQDIAAACGQLRAKADRSGS
ncbi:50S rRNA methyltransferase [Desulfoplanes formicivorans]|uniref:Probable dual-specificity RNA methyltransferase RlmN n=2 Tax=Desulfoplanes formicivorans TaxID=1592317 RepID=A0A194AHK6_9BACT|nr:50S rRNA methyltransferase [Desulfoplanes formicivorans]